MSVNLYMYIWNKQFVWGYLLFTIYLFTILSIFRMQALKTRLVYDQFIIIFYTNVLVLVRSAFVQGCGILTIFVLSCQTNCSWNSSQNGLIVYPYAQLRSFLRKCDKPNCRKTYFPRRKNIYFVEIKQKVRKKLSYQRMDSEWW